MRIGIDIDDTLTNIKDKLTKAARNYAISLKKDLPKEMKNHQIVDIYNNGNIYQKLFNFNDDELKYFLGVIQEEITDNALPREDCVDVIKKLHEDGHEIYIVTARDSEFHKDPYHQSEVWLNKNSCFKIILKSKIIYLYLIYVLIGTIAMSTALGLKMLVLTNYFGYSDNVATNYLLIIGLLADIFGIVALKYLTPKNDYLTITIKFGIRFIGYILAFISNNLIITIIAISWSIFISTSYENICDGVYINRLDNKYQLSFSNICHIIRFLGESIGVFLCGMMYEIGLRYMFGLSAIFMIFQLGIAYYLINLRKKEELINE